MTDFTVGDVALLTATFKDDQSGAPINPDVVTISVKDPDGATTTPVKTNPSVGVFIAVVPFGKAGVWKWKAVATGNGAAASSPNRGSITVKPQSF
jgi:hypothetical protein